MTTLYYDSGFIIGLKAFVGAIIGGLVSYPGTAIGAILVGILESFASFWSSSLKEVIGLQRADPGAAVALAVAASRPTRRTRRSKDDRPRRRPRRHRRDRGLGWRRRSGPPQFTITLLNYIGIYALVALGVVLLTGVGGLTSFGQAAFVGIAAYATAWLTTAAGASPWLGLALRARAHRLIVAASSARSRFGSAATSCRSAPSPGACRSIFCSAIWKRSAATTASPACRRSRSGPLSLAPNQCDLLSDLGRACGRDHPDRQPARLARGPRHPQPARRRA